MGKKKKYTENEEREIIDNLFKMAKGNTTLEMMIDMALVAQNMVEDVLEFPQNNWDRASPITKIRIEGEEYEVQLYFVKDKTHWLRGANMMETQEI